jgi:hypothetical protein
MRRCAWAEGPVFRSDLGSILQRKIASRRRESYGDAMQILWRWRDCPAIS